MDPKCYSWEKELLENLSCLFFLVAFRGFLKKNPNLKDNALKIQLESDRAHKQSSFYRRILCHLGESRRKTALERPKDTWCLHVSLKKECKIFQYI